MVYFVSNNSDGCWYYRCYLPMMYNGFRGDKTSLLGERLPGNMSSQLSLKADTVVFQRGDSRDRLETAAMLKQLGKKIVFENDDTYKDNDPMKFERFNGTLQEKIAVIDDFVRLSDMVTTTTEFLANEYRKLNKNVVVLKNLIDPLQWPTPKRNTGSKTRVGLFGSATMNGDFDSIKGLLDVLSARDDVQLVIMGLPAKEFQVGVVAELYKEELDFWGKLNIEYHPIVSIAEYFKALNDLELDIALIPRRDNYFNRCKSNLKFLEASMLEIPIVAQGFTDGKSPYQGEEDGKHMLIATNDKEWKEHVYNLIRSKESQRQIGKAAKEYVLKNYDASKFSHIWKDAMRTLK